MELGSLYFLGGGTEWAVTKHTRVLHGSAVQRGNPQLRLSWGSPTWLEAWAGVIITQHPQKSDSGWSSWCNLQLGWRSKSLPRQLCHSPLGDYFLIYSSREVQLAASLQAAAQLPATSSDLRGNTQQLPGQRAKPKIKHFLSQVRSCLGSTSASCACAGIRSPVWKSQAALKYQRWAGMSLIALQCTLPMQTCNWRAETSYWQSICCINLIYLTFPALIKSRTVGPDNWLLIYVACAADGSAVACSSHAAAGYFPPPLQFQPWEATHSYLWTALESESGPANLCSQAFCQRVGHSTCCRAVK